MQSLRQCAELLGSTNSLIDSSAILSSKFLDEFNQKGLFLKRTLYK